MLQCSSSCLAVSRVAARQSAGRGTPWAGFVGGGACVALVTRLVQEMLDEIVVRGVLRRGATAACTGRGGRNEVIFRSSIPQRQRLHVVLIGQYHVWLGHIHSQMPIMTGGPDEPTRQRS